MAIKILFITLLAVSVASAGNCCRGYKILQYRRAGVLPMYESSSGCGNIFSHQDDYCDSSLYPSESISKYDAPITRYYPPYVEPKTITHKCVCSKSIASQRIMTTVPRYYKRSYCSDPMIDPPCESYGCGGQYGHCDQYGHCTQCTPYSQCSSCAIPQSLFRQSAHRVLPLTLPASCVC